MEYRGRTKTPESAVIKDIMKFNIFFILTILLATSLYSQSNINVDLINYKTQGNQDILFPFSRY